MSKRNRALIGSLSHDLDGASSSGAGRGTSTIHPEQRFTKERPCPVCGGHDRLPRGKGVRCHGFASEDGEWAHCTREHHAGGLPRHTGSGTYAHRLTGPCACGKTHEARAEPSNQINARRRWEATYRYEDKSGRLLYEVRRYAVGGEKEFLVYRPGPDGYVSGLGGTPKTLYRLPEVMAAIAKGETVFIVEGEKDVDALISLGITATCNPFGAGKFVTEYAALLAGAKVVIIPDSDPVGRDHAQDVARKLVGAAGEVRILDLGTHREDGYDVSDFCAVATTPEALKQARDALVASAATAPEFDSTDKGSPVVKRNNGAGQGSLEFTPLPDLVANVPPEPEWTFDGYVAPESITLVAGRPKVGKTTLVFGLLRAITLGQAFLGRPTRKTGALILTEERRNTLAEKVNRWGLGNSVHALMRYEAGQVPWSEVVEQAVAHCLKHDLGLLIVDTFGTWTGLKGDAENNAGSVQEVLEALQDAAAQGLAVVVVAHQRKASGEHGSAVRGSNAFAGGVDVVVEVERADENIYGRSWRVLHAVSRFESTPDEILVELTEDGYESRGDPDSARAQKDREKILSALATGAATAEELAEATGLSQSTLRRRADRLAEDGAVVKTGTGKRNSPFKWELFDSAMSKLLPAETNPDHTGIDEEAF